MISILLPVLIGTIVSLLVFFVLQKVSAKKKRAEPIHREFIKRGFRRWLSVFLITAPGSAVLTALSMRAYSDAAVPDFGKKLISLVWYGSGALMSLVISLLALYLAGYYYRLMKRL